MELLESGHDFQVGGQMRPALNVLCGKKYLDVALEPKKDLNQGQCSVYGPE